MPQIRLGLATSLLLLVAAVGCDSPAPKASAPEPAAARQAEPEHIPVWTPKPFEPPEKIDWSATEQGACAAADWSEAMSCVGPNCAKEAVGGSCATCIDAAATCLEQNGNDCQSECGKCLGEARCGQAAFNVTRARQVIRQRNLDLGDAEVLFGSRERRADRLMGVAPDGSVIAAGKRASNNAFVIIERTTMIDDQFRRLWAVDHECDDVRVSPDGKWLVVACDGYLQLYELATGFKRLSLPGAEFTFGGDRFVAVESDGKWRRFDLLEGRDAPMPWMSQSMSALSLSRDGARLAVGDQGDLRVVDVDSGATFFETGESGDQIDWQEPSMLLAFDGNTFRRFDLETKSLVQEISFRGDYRMVMTAAGPRFGRDDDDGLYVRGLTTEEVRYVPQVDKTAFTAGYDHLISGWDVLDDGRVIAASTVADLAVFRRDGDPEPANSDSFAGVIRWLTAGDKGEVLFGGAGGAFALQLDSGDHTRLEVPREYRRIGVWGRGTRVVGIGVDQEANLNGTIWVGNRDGSDAVLVRDGGHPTVAVLDPEGVLHVGTWEGLRSYSLGTNPKRLRSMDATRVDISHDGTYALLEFEGATRVVRTGDYELVADLPKGACAFAVRDNVLACGLAKDDIGHVEIVSYSLPKMKELARANGTMLNRAIVTVSDDGQQLLVGSTAFGGLGIDQLWSLQSGIDFLGRGVFSFTPDGRLITAASGRIEVRR